MKASREPYNNGGQFKSYRVGADGIVTVNQPHIIIGYAVPPTEFEQYHVFIAPGSNLNLPIEPTNMEVLLYTGPASLINNPHQIAYTHFRDAARYDLSDVQTTLEELQVIYSLSLVNYHNDGGTVVCYFNIVKQVQGKASVVTDELFRDGGLVSAYATINYNGGVPSYAAGRENITQYDTVYNGQPVFYVEGPAEMNGESYVSADPAGVLHSSFQRTPDNVNNLDGGIQQVLIEGGLYSKYSDLLVYEIR